MKAFTIVIAAVIAGGVASVLPSMFYYSSQFDGLQYTIAGETRDSNSVPSIFENATNLTNNPMDSVYGQVAAWDNNVYMLWQDSVPPGYANYDIFIKTSNDNGTTFGTTVNLSNNPGFSEHPQIATYGDNVYAIWADDSSGNREVIFTRSLDKGISFENISTLSNSTNISDSFNQEIAVFGDDVYVVWLDRGENGDTNILFRASDDGGTTFGNTVNISNNANEETFPKVAAYEGNVYIAWNMIDETIVDIGDSENQGLFFVTSLDGGNNFGDIMTLNQENDFGELQVGAYNETVYVVAGGLHTVSANGLFFATSTDAGTSFSEPVIIDESGTFVNPLNVEVNAYDDQFSYIAAQVSVSGNEEILLIEMDGNDSARVMNLSNNPKISECPSIAMAGDNIYVVWEDMTPGNHEILYAKGSRA